MRIWSRSRASLFHFSPPRRFPSARASGRVPSSCLENWRCPREVLRNVSWNWTVSKPLKVPPIVNRRESGAERGLLQLEAGWTTLTARRSRKDCRAELIHLAHPRSFCLCHPLPPFPSPDETVACDDKWKHFGLLWISACARVLPNCLESVRVHENLAVADDLKLNRSSLKIWIEEFYFTFVYIISILYFVTYFYFIFICVLSICFLCFFFLQFSE